MTSDPLLVYGATGYTGRLIIDAALRRGVRPILAGRDRERLDALAAQYDCEYRVASLADGASLRSALRDIQVVLLAAGPFSHTAVPMADACVRAGVHYLDVTGECAVIEALLARRVEARRQHCMVMPGCGFDVVATDCLARHTAARMTDASYLAIGLSGLVTPTRGSMRTIAEHVGLGMRVRRNGVLTSVPPGVFRRRFDYGRGTGWSTIVTWGDVTTAFYTTGISNIDVYFEETPGFRQALLTAGALGPILQMPYAQAMLKAQAQFFPEGPTSGERALNSCVVVAEVHSSRGHIFSARLKTPEAYSTSAETAVVIAQHVLRGDFESGFQTPARVYGADFILRFDGVSREDLTAADAGRDVPPSRGRAPGRRRVVRA
jgi:short subunit dehydrogenase-like uncharacterized protein